MAINRFGTARSTPAEFGSRPAHVHLRLDNERCREKNNIDIMSINAILNMININVVRNIPR